MEERITKVMKKNKEYQEEMENNSKVILGKHMKDIFRSGIILGKHFEGNEKKNIQGKHSEEMAKG